MKKILALLIIFCMTLCMAACGSGSDESGSAADQAGETAELLTEDQVLEAIKNYCFAANPDLEEMAESDEYYITWEASTNEENEIVVLYRSYSGAEIRYYVDPATGEVHVTEFVSGVMDEEQPTDETFNVKDYLN